MWGTFSEHITIRPSENSVIEQTCSNCQYKHKTSLQEPCSTGNYQMLYSGKCSSWQKARPSNGMVYYIKLMLGILNEQERKR